VFLFHGIDYRLGNDALVLCPKRQAVQSLQLVISPNKLFLESIVDLPGNAAQVIVLPDICIFQQQNLYDDDGQCHATGKKGEKVSCEIPQRYFFSRPHAV